MRRLLLFRHTKSSWAEPGVVDHDRPLNNRGKRDAPRMGRYMRDCGYLPDRIICSTALRTRETLRLALPKLLDQCLPAIEFSSSIYEAPADAIIRAVSRIAAEDATVMVVGHNPGLEQAARDLIGSGDAAARGWLATKFPTGALAVIDFDISCWTELASQSGVLVDFAMPKLLDTRANLA